MENVYYRLLAAIGPQGFAGKCLVVQPRNEYCYKAYVQAARHYGEQAAFPQVAQQKLPKSLRLHGVEGLIRMTKG